MRRSPLFVLYLTVFIDLLGFGIILPVLPFLAEQFGAGGFWVGAILTAYSAAQLVGALFLGRLSDRIGRRPVLLLSLVGSAVSLVGMGLANSLIALLLSRLLAGAFGGSITTAQAYIADVTNPSERTRYMGILGASMGMGFIFGPAIGAGLSGFGFGVTASAAAALAAANFVFGYVALPESRRTSGETTPSRESGSRSLMAALRHPSVGRILAATFLTTFAFVGMEATYALFGQARYGLDAGGLGLIFTFVGIVIAIIQGGLIGRLNARLGERALALAGSVIIAVSLAALPLAPSQTTSILVLGLMAAGQGILTPTLSSLLSLAGDADEQGGMLGFGQSVSAGARAVGPLVAGWLFDRGIALPYVAGAVLTIVAAWVLTGVLIRAPRAVENVAR